MKTKVALSIVLLLIAAALTASVVLYGSLPERIPTHWDIHGQVDGWSSRSFGVFFAPAAMLVMLLMLVGGEWISPIHFKIAPFRDTFNYLLVISTVLLGYVHATVLLAATRPELDLGRWMVGGVFVFLAAIGNLLGKTRRNFWVGIRTPWTHWPVTPFGYLLTVWLPGYWWPPV